MCRWGNLSGAWYHTRGKVGRIRHSETKMRLLLPILRTGLPGVAWRPPAKADEAVLAASAYRGPRPAPISVVDCPMRCGILSKIEAIRRILDYETRMGLRDTDGTRPSVNWAGTSWPARLGSRGRRRANRNFETAVRRPGRSVAGRHRTSHQPFERTATSRIRRQPLAATLPPPRVANGHRNWFPRSQLPCALPEVLTG